MKKLTLACDDLRVESFDTTADAAPPRGTVQAHATFYPDETCDPTACASCGGTCYGQYTCPGYNTCRETCYGWYTCNGYDTCYSCNCVPTQHFGGGCASYDVACYPDPA
jgi:hypothetical protein